MRRLILLAAMSALVLAKPEMYREKEDFQYSRSSSDDGTKSGFYDAQRGNMGGNYEKAHNMDKLAQHQMSGLIGQVNGELGEGAKTRTGSVYTAANSRGMYGSGNYDLSNIKGRNFEEGESYGDSQSHSSLSSQNSRYSGQMYSGLNSAGYNSRNSQSSRYSGYQSSSQMTDHRQADNLQAIDMSQGMRNYESDSQSGHNNRYQSQYEAQRKNELDQNSATRYSSSGYGSDAQTRYIAGAPNLRLVVRPRVIYTVPIAAQTYDLSQSALSEDKTASTSDAEVLDHQINYKPKIKHYESSYSYRKEWEKHNTQPADDSVVVPTENPFPKNSELYDDAQLLQTSNSKTNLAQSNHLNSAYSANTNYGQTQLQSGFNSQQSSSGTDYRANAYRQSSQNSADIHANLQGNGAQNSALSADFNNAESLSLKPKSYHSSYSYHKSWERKGDPYVIEPTSGAYTGLTSQKLTAASANREAYSSHQYGSHSSKSHQSYADDCDEEGHVRVARSYKADQELENQQQQLENIENLGQQTQSKWENQEDLGQQTQIQWDNLQDLGQQTQNQWDQLQQLGQQTQNEWDNLQQLGQQSQNQWDKIEDLGQQSQNQWGKIEDLGQQSQNQWDKIENLGQQSQNQWDKIEDLGQQTQRDLEQKTQNKHLEDLSQQSQKSGIEVPFSEQQVNGENIIEFQKSHSQEVDPPNVWDQKQGFEQQINMQTGKDVQKISATNEQEQNKQVDEFNKNSQYLNPWFQSQNTDLDDDDFLKPVQGLPNKNNDDGESNLFSSIFINPVNNNLNNQGHDIWNQSHYVGNEYSNLNITNTTQTPLQSLWDKIDNIAGEFATADVKTEDKSAFIDEYSTFDSFNQNRDFGDSHFSNPAYQNHYHQSASPKIDTEIVDKENNVQNNIFNYNKKLQRSTETTTQNPVVTPDSKLIIDSQQISNPEQKQFSVPEHLANIGRGDIGPEDALHEIATADKSYKSSEEIETIGLPKDDMVKNLDIVVGGSHYNQSRYEDNETERSLTVLSLRDQEKDGPHRQHKLYSIVLTANHKTTTTPQSVAIIKQTYNSNSGQFGQIDINTTTEVKMDIKPISHVQNNEPLQRADIFDDIQQQNIQQQYDNYGQDENTGQLQTSWFPSENLQQEYDQQNVERQFEDFEQHANIQELTPLQDFGQQEQDPWNSQNILQGYQNTDQQFEVFQQDNIGSATLLQNFGDQKQDTVKLDDVQQPFEKQNMVEQQRVIVKDQSQDIGQKEQEIWKTVEITQNQKMPGNLKKENVESQSDSNKLLEEIPIQVKPESYLESNKDTKPISDLKLDVASTPVEVTTQKPGFWKSIGTKFSNAKEKVASWFQQHL